MDNKILYYRMLKIFHKHLNEYVEYKYPPVPMLFYLYIDGKITKVYPQRLRINLSEEETDIKYNISNVLRLFVRLLKNEVKYYQLRVYCNIVNGIEDEYNFRLDTVLNAPKTMYEALEKYSNELLT